MEEIRKKADGYYYGEYRCVDCDDAYRRFREDYHEQLGSNVHLRLNRLGKRKERIHDNCSYYSDPSYVESLRKEFSGAKPVKYRILGLVGISYYRIFSGADLPDYDDDKFSRWVDWALCRGSGAIRITGRKDGAGRTSKFLNKDFI